MQSAELADPKPPVAATPEKLCKLVRIVVLVFGVCDQQHALRHRDDVWTTAMNEG